MTKAIKDPNGPKILTSRVVLTNALIDSLNRDALMTAVFHYKDAMMNEIYQQIKKKHVEYRNEHRPMELLKQFVDMSQIIPCAVCDQPGKVDQMIMHMNDSHKLARELISEYLNNLHEEGVVDLEIKIGEPAYQALTSENGENND